MKVKSDLKLVFTGLVTQYADIGKLFDSYWKEIVEAYSSEQRHYHNLHHLHYVYSRLEECPQKPVDREALLFCLFYHDIVYNIRATDNEERSANIAVLRMEGVGAKKQSIELCKQHILATRTHEATGSPDSDLFCDADIAILGEVPERFAEYCRRVRLEYLGVADEEYNGGRARELESLNNRKELFHTEYFRNRYEDTARKNLEKEILRLKGK